MLTVSPYTWCSAHCRSCNLTVGVQHHSVMFRLRAHNGSKCATQPNAMRGRGTGQNARGATAAAARLSRNTICKITFSTQACLNCPILMGF
ncbi:hypothetical protein K439DRAFT_366003 [Ramaria rubella]|nr:hypothetical protein K439DRAFT_366003 [Ramaria rubella]